MRGRLRKKVVACFSQEFTARFPQFAAYDRKEPYPTWSWKIASNLRFFVVLQAFSGKDKFVINVAWADGNEVPYLGPAEVYEAEGCERVGALWNRARGKRHEYIWDLAPEKTAAMEADIEALARGEHLPYPEDPPVDLLIPRIAPLVHDAIEKFEQYGIPLFRRVAEAHGVPWPDAAPGAGDQLKGEQ